MFAYRKGGIHHAPIGDRCGERVYFGSDTGRHWNVEAPPDHRSEGGVHRSLWCSALIALKWLPVKQRSFCGQVDRTKPGNEKSGKPFTLLTTLSFCFLGNFVSEEVNEGTEEARTLCKSLSFFCNCVATVAPGAAPYCNYHPPSSFQRGFSFVRVWQCFEFFNSSN